jgi:hypothetical protein
MFFNLIVFISLSMPPPRQLEDILSRYLHLATQQPFKIHYSYPIFKIHFSWISQPIHICISFFPFPFYYFCLLFHSFHFTFIVNFWILFAHSFSILAISFTYDHPMISEHTTPSKERDIQYDIYSFGNPASLCNAAMIKSKNSCSTHPFLTLTTWL